MKKFLQVFSGGFTRQEADLQRLKERLNGVLKRKKIDGLIIGWYESREFYQEAKNFLKPFGTKLYFWLPVFSEQSHYREFAGVLDCSGNEIENFSFQEGENFEFYCPNTENNIENIKEIFNKHFKDYEIDGVFLDKIRYPAFSNGGKAVFSCFCPVCIEKMKEQGIDTEALKKYIENSFASEDENPLEITGYKNFRYSFRDTNLDRYFKFKNDTITEKVTGLIRFFKEQGLEVGLDTYAPEISYLFGQDVERLSQEADFIKPMYYRRTYAPAGIPFEITKFGELYTPKAAEYLVKLIGEEEQRDNIGKKQMTEDIRWMSENLKNIYCGIDFNKKEKIALSSREYIEEVFDILEAGKAQGIVLSWDLMSIPEEHLEVFLERGKNAGYNIRL